MKYKTHKRSIREILKEKGNQTKLKITRDQVLYCRENIHLVLNANGRPTASFFLETNMPDFTFIMEKPSKQKCEQLLKLFENAKILDIALNLDVGESKNRIGTQIAGGFIGKNRSSGITSTNKQQRQIPFNLIYQKNVKLYDDTIVKKKRRQQPKRKRKSNANNSNNDNNGNNNNAGGKKTREKSELINVNDLLERKMKEAEEMGNFMATLQNMLKNTEKPLQ